MENNRYKLENPVEKNVDSKNMPLKSFKAGPVRATVWENATERDSVFNTISLSRSYKDKNGAWQNSSVLRLNDLPKASVVLNKAYEYLVSTGSNNSPEMKA